MSPSDPQPSIEELLKRVKMPPPRDDPIEMDATAEEMRRPASPEEKQQIRATIERRQRLLDLANKERPGQKPFTLDDRRGEGEPLIIDGPSDLPPTPLPPAALAASLVAREKFRAWLIKLDQEQNGERALVP